ncbi:hypothetical protein ACIQXD_36350 [Streptomyces uncialis]|uniref:hypothetical protein n=1 Tax=Streptomyces uncialis TaxID=1048205 RepID=UPI0037F121AD
MSDVLDPIRRKFLLWVPTSRDGSIPHPGQPQTGAQGRETVCVVVVLVLVLTTQGRVDAAWVDVLLRIWLR